MKKTLLLFLVITASAGAQQTIPALNGSLSLQSNYGGSIVTTANTVNQTPAGFDMVWNFGATTAVLPRVYANSVPTAAEIIDFPGSVMVTTSETPGDSSNAEKIYVNSEGRMVGKVTSEYNVYYSGDSAFFGTFPLSYGDLSLDTVSGTYFYDGYTGTFEGTMISEVDAYGDLTFAPGETSEVTRLKTIETLQLSYAGLGIVGTYVQTTYRYYISGLRWPLFMSTRTDISIPVLEIDSDVTVYERGVPALSVIGPQADAFTVGPNPVRSVLTVTSDVPVLAVSILDMTGKKVLESATATVDMGTLPAAVYLARITTTKGTGVRKIIKQ